MTASDGYSLNISSILAQNFGSITSTYFFSMGPRWSKPIAAIKMGSLTGTGNLKVSFQHSAHQNTDGADWVQLLSLGTFNAHSATSTLLNSTVMSNPLMPYGRLTMTVESTNSGVTTFNNVVAKLLAEIL